MMGFRKLLATCFQTASWQKKYEAEKTKTSQIIKRKGNLKNLNCRPTSKQKGDLKFVELILLWSSLQRLGLL